MTTKHECLNECIWKDVSSMQTLFVLCGGQGRELQSVCLSVCGSVRFLAAFGSSAKLCPEHSYAPAKGTSFENGGTKRVKISLRLSSLSSLNLWFCELVGKDQRWSKMIKESKCPKVSQDQRLILQVQKRGLRVARGRLAWGIASVVIACHALSLLQAYSKQLKRTKRQRWLPWQRFCWWHPRLPTVEGQDVEFGRDCNDGLTLDLTKQY